MGVYMSLTSLNATMKTHDNNCTRNCLHPCIKNIENNFKFLLTFKY